MIDEEMRAHREANEPTREHVTTRDIQKFLEVFKRLEMFEAQQRMVRGYGAFQEVDLPFPR